MVAVVVLGLFWRQPELWLLHSFDVWKTHEIQNLLDNVLQKVEHTRPGISRAPR